MMNKMGFLNLEGTCERENLEQIEDGVILEHLRVPANLEVQEDKEDLLFGGMKNMEQLTSSFKYANRELLSFFGLEDTAQAHRYTPESFDAALQEAGQEFEILRDLSAEELLEAMAQGDIVLCYVSAARLCFPEVSMPWLNPDRIVCLCSVDLREPGQPMVALLDRYDGWRQYKLSDFLWAWQASEQSCYLIHREDKQ